MIEALVLRLFTATDTDAVIDLRNRAFEELSGDAYTAAQKAALRENRTQKGYAEELIQNHIMLAFDDALGLVAMGGWIEMPGDATIGRIRKLAVHPSVARRGIGRHMVEDAERRARDAGCRSFVVRSSLNAVPFYESLGYRITGHGVVPTAAGIDIPMTMMAK
ncbi:MAG TPA: GNAT family N-acetyltransferase [Verrucomicrobiae bacterium]|nr:GNAT family N-acetyltransferase [Verrucomicrobiae bacterium]